MSASNKYEVGDLRFNVLFNSISVISGRWADDYKGLCAIESRNGTSFTVEKISHPAGLELRNARLVGQCLAHWSYRAPNKYERSFAID